MPAARQTLMRYRIINSCLTNPKKLYPKWTDIQKAMARENIHVEKRAIESDLEDMRHDKRLGYHAPIEYNRKYRGYHYTNPEYNIDKLPLTREEIDSFEIIIESLKRFRGADILNQVSGVFDKLDKVIVKQLKSKKAPYSVIDFEKMPYTKGIEHFDKLYKAILDQQTLLITYKAFGKPTSEHVFYPYLLKEYKLRWYVLGYSERHEGNVVLALDRIETIAPKNARFRMYRGNNIENYFKHTLGVTIDKSDVKNIQLWFSPTQANYIRTQPLHATQRTIQDDRSGLTVELRLIPNYELVQTILSFGAEVKVLEPRTLQLRVKEVVKKTLEQYR